MKYRKAVFIVTYDRSNNKKILYLLLYRRLHWKGWEFPKGGIERFEFKKTAVKRELKEETGQTSSQIKKYPVSGKYKYNEELEDRPGFVGQSYKLFSAEVKNRKVKFDKREHSKYEWVDYKTAMKLLKWPNQRKCLRIVNNYLNNKKRIT